MITELMSPGAAARELRPLLERRLGKKVHAKPWSRFQQDKSLYWLIPSADWPARAHAKIFFDIEHAPTNQLFAGLYVEKGFEGAATFNIKDSSQKALVLKPEWSWHAVHEGMSNGALAQSAALAQQRTGPLTLLLDVNFATEPDRFNPLASARNQERVVYTWDNGKLTEEPAKGPSTFSRALRGATDLETLAQKIDRFSDRGWYWIDFLFGSFVERENTGVTPDSGEQLFQAVVDPWLEWLGEPT